MFDNGALQLHWDWSMVKHVHPNVWSSSKVNCNCTYESMLSRLF